MPAIRHEVVFTGLGQGTLSRESVAMKHATKGPANKGGVADDGGLLGLEFQGGGACLL